MVHYNPEHPFLYEAAATRHRAQEDCDAGSISTRVKAGDAAGPVMLAATDTSADSAPELKAREVSMAALLQFTNVSPQFVLEVELQFGASDVDCLHRDQVTSISPSGATALQRRRTNDELDAADKLR
eukprot:SAG31_NODE_10704_length_1108_cov_1.156591_2_plen_127_part_00